MVEKLTFSSRDRNGVGKILPSEGMLVSDVFSEVLFDATGAEIVLLACKLLVELLAFLVLLGEDVDRRGISTVREEFGENSLDL